MHRTLLATTLLAGGLLAQDYQFLCGFADSGGPAGPTGNSFPVSRFRDLDGDGTISDLNELFPFVSTSFNTRNATGSFMSDMEWVREGSNHAFYLSDSADGRIVRGVDHNNNGLLDSGEVTEFFDFQSGNSPDGITVFRNQNAANPRTIVYVVQDDSASPFARGIHRLVDLNGNGNATDPNEHTVFVNAAMNLTVPGTGGPVTLVSHLWEQVHALDNGTVIAYSRGSTSATSANTPDQYAWYAFTDNNGVATASVLFNPSRINGLPTHPAFAVGGTFPQWDVSVTSGTTTKPWANVEYFTKGDRVGSGREYYFGASYNTGFVYTNPQAVNVHGLFYRWSDSNGDFRIGASEMSLFANFSNAAVAGVQPFQLNAGGNAVIELNDRTFWMRWADGQLHVCWGLIGAMNKAVMALTDGNGNGIIDPVGEADRTYLFSGATTGVYHAMFGPFIKDGTAFDRGLMPGPFPAGLVPAGQGCANPDNGLAPVCGAYGGAPSAGNTGFEVSCERLLPGTLLAALIGLAPINIPLPQPIALPNCFALTAPILDVPGLSVDQDGIALMPLPISAGVPTGVSVRLQFLFLSQTATQFGSSNALDITVQ